MLQAPQRYIDWINRHPGFNPRGQGHSDALTGFIFDDLLLDDGPLGCAISEREFSFYKNVGMDGIRKPSLSSLLSGFSAFAPGPSAEEPDAEEEESALDTNIDGVILKGADAETVAPARTVVSIENKSIMTAHSKARTNRWNDARAFAGHVHDVDESIIAAFTIAINTSSTYLNPDKFSESAASTGTNNAKAIAITLGLFGSRTTLPLRNLPSEPRLRCEAVWIIALKYDGRTPTATLDTEHPLAPRNGSRCSYEDFIRRISARYGQRFIR